MLDVGGEEGGFGAVTAVDELTDFCEELAIMVPTSVGSLDHFATG